MKNKHQQIFILKLLLAFSFCFVFIQCSNSEEGTKKVEEISRDYTIDDQNAFSEMELDSARLEQYIAERKMDEQAATMLRNFYNSRNYHFAWFTSDGLAEQTRAFWNLHNNHVRTTNDSTIYDKQLHDRMELLINEEDEQLNSEELTNLELHLSQHFFTYAKYAYEGTIDPSDLQWHIPRKKVDPVSLLDSLIATKGEKLDDWEPVNQQYHHLKDQLIRYYKIEKNGGWPTINLQDEIYIVGDTADAIAQLKNRLSVTGDFTPVDSVTRAFTPQLEDALRATQTRFGLKEDGVLGPATAGALNVPVKERIKQMLVNMERMKWMPKQAEGTRLVANIPDFKLHVYEGKDEAFNMKIVVGKAANKTVVFSDVLEYVVFSPYWNIPRSIIRNEILPAMERNPGYLARNNMEQTGTRNGLPVIRQNPGGSNALGRVKFIFPNNYAIYFHDTPAKHLFSRSGRAFSHGCIRLEEPTRLAEYLLRNNESWNSSRIFDAMHAGEEKWVKLENEIPVYISYFTAWADNDKVNFREDIYGHDERLMNRMF